MCLSLPVETEGLEIFGQSDDRNDGNRSSMGIQETRGAQ